MIKKILEDIENIEFTVMNMEAGVGEYNGFDTISKDLKSIKEAVKNLNLANITRL